LITIKVRNICQNYQLFQPCRSSHTSVHCSARLAPWIFFHTKNFFCTWFCYLLSSNIISLLHMQSLFDRHVKKFMLDLYWCHVLHVFLVILEQIDLLVLNYSIFAFNHLLYVLDTISALNLRRPRKNVDKLFSHFHFSGYSMWNEKSKLIQWCDFIFVQRWSFLILNIIKYCAIYCVSTL